MTKHHAVVLSALALSSGIFLFLGFCWGKGRSALSGTPLGIWVGGVCSAFIGGFVEGTPIGSTAGAGFAVADGEIHADLKLAHIAIEAAHLLAIPVGTGLADVRNFIKTNPFPNVFLPQAAAPSEP